MSQLSGNIAFKFGYFQERMIALIPCRLLLRYAYTFVGLVKHFLFMCRIKKVFKFVIFVVCSCHIYMLC